MQKVNDHSKRAGQLLEIAEAIPEPYAAQVTTELAMAYSLLALVELGKYFARYGLPVEDVLNSKGGTDGI